MSTYTYRRDLKREDWIKVAGAGAAAAVAVAYLARILLQRTPLRPGPPAPIETPGARYTVP